jgi:hypothetical protein
MIRVSGRTVSWLLPQLLVGMLAANELSAQPLRTVTLSNVQAELTETFTNILSLRELGDGRVIVSDNRDKVVQLADFKQQTLTKIGREGAGPGEYTYPQRLYALKSDTSALYDIGNDRYLLILPNGKPGVTRPAEDPSGYSTDLLGMDKSGRVYFKASRSGAATSGVRMVLRYNAATKQADSIATLAEPVGENVIARTLPGGMLRMSTNLPYVARDVATIAPDGSIIIARASDYHVDWFSSNGKRVSGPPIAYTPIAIDAQEKRTFMERQIRPGAIISSANPSASGVAQPRARSGMPPGVNNADIYDDKGMTWPARIPPFLDGTLSVDGMGRVWVKRTVPFNELSASYDVFDATAKRVLTVKLPPRAKLVGFGRNSVYLVRTDDDDLQHLQRYAAP